MRASVMAAVTVTLLICSAVASAETFHLRLDFFQTPPTTAAVVGSFNDWSASAAPMSFVDGAFVATVPLDDGEYTYAFATTYPDGTDSLVLDPDWTAYEPEPDGTVANCLVLESGVRVLPDDLELFEWSAADARDVVLAGDFNN